MASAFQPAGDHEHAAYHWLTSLKPLGIRLGLDRVQRALEALGSPHDRLRAVTIAGTNGKGSTAAFLASAVHQAGYRVGLYTSPHLVSVTERIRVGGTAILAHELARWAAEVRRVVEGGPGRAGIPLTFFEALTVMAIAYFAEREVDLAILEVGMGGRLDATAVVPPLVTVVTPIAMDHQAYLGDSLEAICSEKAGIMRPQVPLVTAETGALFRTVLGPRAYMLRAATRRVGVDFVYRWLPQGFRYRGWMHRLGPVRLGLRGVHQGLNASLACATAEVLCDNGFHLKAAAVAEGLQRARHPGRLDYREPRLDGRGRAWPALLLDGAHNVAAARVLAPQVPAFLEERPRVMLFAARDDKDAEAMLDELLPVVDEVILTTVEGGQIGLPKLARRLARSSEVPLTFEPDPGVALELARRHAGPDGGVLVTGSLYLVGDILPRIPAPHMPLHGVAYDA